MNKISDKRLQNFYSNKKNSCKCRKIAFELSKEQCRELLQIERCAYTDVIMTFTESNSAQLPTDVTLERVDCTKAYTVENTIAICKAANNAKNAFEVQYRENASDMLRKMADSLGRIEQRIVEVEVLPEVKYNAAQRIVKWLACKVGV